MDNLYDYIFKRKSVRKYTDEKLDGGMLNKITQFADTLIPLLGDIKTEYEITDSVKNIMPVTAPHYFIISSEQKEGFLINAGFLWEQMDLFLSSLGLGACWLGMAKPAREPKTELTYVIALAFGRAADSPYRELVAFKRKPLSDISSGSDERLEVVRLAPSASNSQNWFFDAHDGEIDVYQKKLNPVMSAMYYKFNQVDMGIALYYLKCASQKAGKNFEFICGDDRAKNGYVYIGTVR